MMGDDWGKTVSYSNEKDQSYVSVNFFIYISFIFS